MKTIVNGPGGALILTGSIALALLPELAAATSITATGGTFTYDGSPHSGSGSATGSMGEVLSVALSYAGIGATFYGPTATAPTNAGTYQVTASTPGDVNNSPATSSPDPLTIDKFNTLMAAFGGTLTYDGSPHAGSGQARGGAGETLPVTLGYLGISGTTYGPTAAPPTNVGVYLVTAHTAGDANNNAEDSLPNALRVNKATVSNITVTGYCFDFDSAAHTATGSATGVLNEALTGLDLSGTTHTAAGTYASDAWSFSNANYLGANGTVGDSIVNSAISAPAVLPQNSSGAAASVADAGAGATYAWTISGGTITGGAGTRSITFGTGSGPSATLQVAITTTTGCSRTSSVQVQAAAPTQIPALGPLPAALLSLLLASAGAFGLRATRA